MENLRHKIGDTVKVKSYEWYTTNAEDGIVCNSKTPLCFTPEMAKYCDCEFKIGDIFFDKFYNKNTYLLIGTPFQWDDYMFEDNTSDTNIDNLLSDILLEYGRGYINLDETMKKIKSIRYNNVEETKKENKLEDKTKSISDFINKQFDNIISEFDINGAYEHMKSLNWHYWNCETCISEPVTIDSIKQCIKDLLISSLKTLKEHCDDEIQYPSSVRTGGFKVTTYIDKENLNNISFIIEYIPFDYDDYIYDMDKNTLIELKNE